MTKLRVIERNEEPTDQTTDRLRYLIALQRKVLWLSAWMIHNANHLRPSRDGLKVVMATPKPTDPVEKSTSGPSLARLG